MHPSASDADRLIVELIRSQRAATSEEIRRITERMAIAPFHPSLVRMPHNERGASCLGHTLGAVPTRSFITGYQIARVTTASIPESVQWLG